MPDIWGIASILAKLGLYIGFAGSTGLVIVSYLCSGFVAPISLGIKRQARALAWLALAATVVGFLLRGAALTGGVDGMVDPEMLGLLWQTSVGDAFVYRLIGAVLILVGLSVPRFGQWIALLGGTVALWSFAQIGHVPELESVGIQLLLLLHLLCVAFWVGIFSPLRSLALMPEHLTDAAGLGHRFGQAAALIVPTLIVAGLWMAWLLVGNLQGILFTDYGQALLFKVLLVGLLLILAAANKLRFVPSMQSGDAKAARHLARSIEVEAIVVLVVLATTATLTSVLTLPS
ncbi:MULTISPECIES: copper resistance D family protein [unclassified Ruegeria]|uniref:copper resistance D family protein n=1 Tax=unclassified Ruegeria TaxID=2625375 RepID=UPI00149152FD|nr:MULTISPECIES: CopD family protein [unclassified Ruegeria]NOD35683.1 copper-binding protein [Ruegeria sp. HKCCD7296]NOE43050.1 copper-binding protein [Ruegeria sp. HKCCD7319]